MIFDMTTLTNEISFSWSVADLQRRLGDGYVVKPFWKLQGSKGAFTVYRSGSLSFPDGTPDLPYASITEEIAINWVRASIGASGVAALQDSIAAELDKLINPVFGFGLPWAPIAEPQITPELTVLSFVEGQSALQLPGPL